MAETIRQSCRADGMLFVPTRRHPLKPHTELSNYSARVAMIKAAIAGNDYFQFFSPPRDSGYTIDLLGYLCRKCPAAKFFLAIGSDIIDEFEQWYQYDEIIRTVEIVIAYRPGYVGSKRANKIMKNAKRISIPQCDISSTDIRKRVKTGRSIKYLVPAAVEKIIYNRGLYAG